MLQRIILLVLLMGSWSASLLAGSGYLGVYSQVVDGLTSADGELLGFAPQESFKLSVSVANEEGGDELFLDGGIQAAVQVEVLIDGETSLVAPLLEWASLDNRYAFFGGLPPEPSTAGILEPGVGLETELVIRNSDGSPFSAGHYDIRILVVPASVRFSDDSPWSGRGGLGGVSFELRDVDGLEDRITDLQIRGRDALQAGLFDQAAERFTEAVELDSNDEDSWGGLGLARHHLGDHQGAVDALERVLPSIIEHELHTTLPLLLAKSHVVLGDLDRAENALRAIIEESAVRARLDELIREVAGE